MPGSTYKPDYSSITGKAIAVFHRFSDAENNKGIFFSRNSLSMKNFTSNYMLMHQKMAYIK